MCQKVKKCLKEKDQNYQLCVIHKIQKVKQLDCGSGLSPPKKLNMRRIDEF